MNADARRFKLDLSVAETDVLADSRRRRRRGSACTQTGCR